MPYINRLLADKIKAVEPFYPVVVLTGPRQSGKTTLLKHLYGDYHFVNLEQPGTKLLAQDDPEGFLDMIGPKAIIDEVQNVPELLSSIQARVDADKSLRYKLTGSSDFSLMHSISQSLAGRAALFTLLPFAFEELSGEYMKQEVDVLEFSGFYPGVIADGIPSTMFYDNYYRTYVERDVRDLLQVRNIDKFYRYMRLLAGRCGTEFNASSLAVEAGISAPTASQWLSILKTSYIAFELPPFFANINKRLTKSAKIYLYDTGLLCYLLGISSPEQLSLHPLRGAIFENMVVAEMMKRAYNCGEQPHLYFYREKSGVEIDIVQESGIDVNMYEIKASRTYRPEFKANMETVAKSLPRVGSRTVIYDGPSMPPTAVNFREL